MYEATENTGFAIALWRSTLVLDAFVLVFTLCAAGNHGGVLVLLLLTMAVITGLAYRYAVRQGMKFVHRVKRTWKSVCAGLGGNFEGEVNDYVASVRAGMQSKGRYYVATQTKVAYPTLKNIHGNAQAFTAEVSFWHGQTIDDYTKHAAAFALAFEVPFVNFDLSESGLIRIRAGALPIPQAYDFAQLELSDD
ncbi:MAG: hypothetical protein ACJ8CB_32950 [Ktedonobacteraceae bacterium]